MIEKLSPELQQALAGFLGMFPIAALARFLFHYRMVRDGCRTFWSLDLLWELPMAIFCAMVGGGVAAGFELDGMAAYSVVGVVSWLGPRGMEIMLARWLDGHGGKS